MQISFADLGEPEPGIARLRIDGNLVKYSVPPVTGTHSECFNPFNETDAVRFATDEETIAYACAALNPRNGEWNDQNRIRFPRYNHMRVRKFSTTIPLKDEYGALAGGLLVDEDLNGLGIKDPLNVPEDLSRWNITDSGIYVQGNRKFAPYNTWYTEHWNETNGGLIALSGSPDAAESIARVAVDSGRTLRPLWKINLSQISAPVKSVPMLSSDNCFRLDLSCCFNGDCGNGCAVMVAKSA